MFRSQVERYLPLPDYDLSDPSRVEVAISGRILDAQYSRLLMERTDLQLEQIVLLDKVQKQQPISKKAHTELRKAGLIEGRYPNSIIAGPVARAVGQPARHVRERGMDHQYYRDLVLELIRQHPGVSRAQVDEVLIVKLPDAMSEKQKRNRVHNILGFLSQKGLIRNAGTRGDSKWVLAEEAFDRTPVDNMVSTPVSKQRRRKPPPSR